MTEGLSVLHGGLDKNMVRVYIRNLREKEDRYRQMKLAGVSRPERLPVSWAPLRRSQLHAVGLAGGM